MPRVPLLDPATPQSGRSATAQDYGGGEGLFALGRGVSDLADVGARLTDAEYRARAARAATGAARRMSERAAEITASPDFGTYEQRYDEALAEIRAEEGEGLPEAYRDAYEAEVEDFASRGRLAVRQEGRKRQVIQITADIDQAMVDLANEEAEAENEVDARAVRQKAARLLGEGMAIGALDQAGADKRGRSYADAVADAALTRGLAADPEATLRALRAKRGPYAGMDADDRAKAELAATRRIETGKRLALAEERHALALAERQERDEARAAIGEAYTLAIQPGGLTPEWLAANADRFAAQPQALGPLLKIVEKGGRVDTSKPADPSYFREVALEQATDKAAALGRVIDPAKAGNQFEELVRAQADLAEGKTSKTESFIAKVALRVGDSKASFKGGVFEDPWGWSRNADPALVSQFYVDAQEARQRWVAAKGAQPGDTEELEILDQVTLAFVAEHGGQAVTSGLPQVETPENPLAGISAAHLGDVRASLNARGIPATPANVRRHYDLLVAAGAIQPAGPLAGAP